MPGGSFCQEVVGWKPVSTTIYSVLLAGILFASLYVLLGVYDVNKSITWMPSSLDSVKNGSSLDSVKNDTGKSNNNFVPTEWLVSNSSSTLTPQNLTNHQNITMVPPWQEPSNKEMPPLESFKLTKELVEKTAKDNIIIVTFGNHAFMEFILNWVKHLADLDLSNVLVGALDVKLLEALYWKGIPVFDMGSHMATEDVGWGTAAFHKMGRQKVLLLDALLPFGFEVLLTDTDVVWLKNPLPYFDRYPDADILTSTDHLVPTVVDDNLDKWTEAGSAYNIGIFYWRPTVSSRNMLNAWKKMLLADDSVWDQNGFNDILKKKLGPSVADSGGLVYAFDGNLKLGLLPASIFCSGHTYFVQAMAHQFRLNPYAVHTTFQYSGTEGKRHRLREAMLFYDPPEYYDMPGGFLSFNPSIPRKLFMDGPHNVESHFNLVNYQIVQIRTALAVASLLKRTLVMPPIWCRLDRFWFSHPGIVIGSVTTQPFLCPMDHVFEVNYMLKNLSVDEFGDMINFREYSFLGNPLVPKHVKDSLLDVQVCEEGLRSCQATDKVRSGVLRFPRKSSEQTFKNVFSAFKDVKVIHFSSMQDVFQGFADKGEAKRFRRRVNRYVGLWCCVNHDPGHIYYDMYWDEKRNWKPLPPKSHAVDRPPWTNEE